MSRQHATPLLLENGDVHKLERVPKTFNEGFLQDLVQTSPDLIPIDEIEPAFADLLPLCREMSTSAGFVDNVFINDAGLLTIVECKLYRNPQALREVVGQILDYARAISRWNYETLQQAVARADPTKPSLFEYVSSLSEDVDEADFIDAVSRNLRRGRFLLIILGDGIREGVDYIADFLKTHATLSFGFALVEIGIYATPETIGGGHLIVPRIIAQTLEIERAVIDVVSGKVTPPQVSTQSEEKSSRPRKLSEHMFFEKLADVDAKAAQNLKTFVELARDRGLDIAVGRGLMVKRIQGQVKLNFGIFQPDNTFYNFGIAGSTQPLGDKSVGENYLYALANLIGGEVFEAKGKAQWTVKLSGALVPAPNVLAVQEQWLELIEETIQKVEALEAKREFDF